MIESIVAGTPVIAMNRGSVLEVIAHGQTGWICETVEDCIAEIEPVSQLDRQGCRNHVVQNFSVQRMANGYEAIYQKIVTQPPVPTLRPPMVATLTNTLN
ncbi:MAG: glycosyltransferase [Leptolyngbyaceae cyanobacterium]